MYCATGAAVTSTAYAVYLKKKAEKQKNILRQKIALETEH